MDEQWHVVFGKRFCAKTQRRQDAKEDKKANKNTSALWHACDIECQVEMLFLNDGMNCDNRSPLLK